MRGIIYKFENIINGKVYIGQTTRPERRYKEHCSGKEDSLLTRAMLKYGIENFKYEVLETVDKEQLNDREIYWIDYYNSVENGYNLTYGGDYHFKVSPVIRKKLSDAHKGKTLSEEHKKKISESGKGRQFPEEHKKKIGISLKGRIPWNKGKSTGPLSEETRRKISESRKGQHPSEETKRKISESVKRVKSLNKN